MATAASESSSLTATVVPYDVSSARNQSHDADVTANPMEGFPYPSLHSWTRIIIASVVVTLIMLVIVLGNVLVVVAIAVDRRLKGVQHWFIGSLAASDLLVGLFIMPFSLANEVMGYWAFGDIICQLWLSTDVLLCTASILNLCLISLDRYWTITRPIDYVRHRTPRRAALMISVVWSLSMVISLPPLVGWKRPQPTHLGFPLCQLSSEVGYVLYSTMGSFYVPLLVMVLVYVKIYLAARARARRTLRSAGASFGPTAVGMATASPCVNNARLQLPTVHVDVDSTDDLECEGDFMSSQSAAAGGKQNQSETCTDEQREMLLNKTTNDDTDKQDRPDNDKSEGSDSGHRLAVEYHAVGDECAGLKLGRCSESRADDVITVDSADRLLPQSPTPRSITAINARRRAEFFGLKPPTPDHSDQVITLTPLVTATPSRGRSHQPSLTPRRSMIVDEQERSKRKLARARERRATLVLGIVMASFIGCWLPFFSIYPLTLLFDLDVPEGLFAVIFWLGYCNSALNPFIYTIFNRDFRAAFVSILCRQRGTRKYGGPGGQRRQSHV